MNALRKTGEWSVLFKLVQAATEKDNVKAEKKRLFVPRLDAVTVEAGETESAGVPPSGGSSAAVSTAGSTRAEARGELPHKRGTPAGNAGPESRLQAEVPRRL